MYINIHTHRCDESADIYILNCHSQNTIPEKNTKELLSCGIHPWYLKELDIEKVLREINSYASSRKIVAIGECGLDSNCQNIELQRYAFEKQICISEEQKLPLIIHSVKQHHEVLRLRKKYKSTQPWIVHGFRGKIDLFKQFEKQNIFVSLGPSFFKDVKKAKLFMDKANLRYLFLETDDTEMEIKQLYDFVEENTIISNDMWIEIIEDNFKKIFY